MHMLMNIIYGWKYIWSKPRNLTKVLCRIRNHPYGPVYFNPGGLEPDYRCKNCGDNIQ